MTASRMAKTRNFRVLAGNAIAPLAALVAFLAAWEALVRLFGLPPYVLPAPSLILARLYEDRALMASSLWVTMNIALQALALATLGGVGLALLMARSKWLERT